MAKDNGKVGRIARKQAREDSAGLKPTSFNHGEDIPEKVIQIREELALTTDSTNSKKEEDTAMATAKKAENASKAEKTEAVETPADKQMNVFISEKIGVIPFYIAGYVAIPGKPGEFPVVAFKKDGKIVKIYLVVLRRGVTDQYEFAKWSVESKEDLENGEFNYSTGQGRWTYTTEDSVAPAEFLELNGAELDVEDIAVVPGARKPRSSSSSSNSPEQDIDLNDDIVDLILFLQEKLDARDWLAFQDSELKPVLKDKKKEIEHKERLEAVESLAADEKMPLLARLASSLTEEQKKQLLESLKG